DAKVMIRTVPHTGLTNGYRIEQDGGILTYISDHQMPVDGSMGIADSVLELADGADLLIHDSQYTPDEVTLKAHWGHCTVGYAVHVAREAVVKTLALFPHDPAHSDEIVDALLAGARRMAGDDFEVIAAAERTTVV